MRDGIKVFSFSTEKVLKKYGKCFLKMCGNSVSRTQVARVWKQRMFKLIKKAQNALVSLLFYPIKQHNYIRMSDSKNALG